MEQHPEFIDGTKTKEEILDEFMDQWDTINDDGKVTKEEFLK